MEIRQFAIDAMDFKGGHIRTQVYVQTPAGEFATFFVFDVNTDNELKAAAMALDDAVRAKLRKLFDMPEPAKVIV